MDVTLSRAYAVANVGIATDADDDAAREYAVANVGIEPQTDDTLARAYALAGDVVVEDPLLAVKAYDGAVWQPSPLRRWNGKGWVRPQSFRYWDGSTWQTLG